MKFLDHMTKISVVTYLDKSLKKSSNEVTKLSRS